MKVYVTKFWRKRGVLEAEVDLTFSPDTVHWRLLDGTIQPLERPEWHRTMEEARTYIFQAIAEEEQQILAKLYQLHKVKEAYLKKGGLKKTVPINLSA